MWVTGNTGVTLAGNTPQQLGGPCPDSTTPYNSNNQISGANYDAGGNQTVVNGDTLAYDGENRVTSALDGVTHSTETYLYDGDGQRVEKSGPAGATVYIYDTLGRLAAEFATASNSSPCATCYLSSDQLGSTRLVTDASGSVVARHDYLPFGEEVSPNTTDNISQKFTGQERDSETGMDFFHARYFGAALGRFTSPDPANAGADLTNPQTWNAYSYVTNNPLGLVDPSGMFLSANPGKGNDDDGEDDDDSGDQCIICFSSCLLCFSSGNGGGGGNQQQPSPPRITEGQSSQTPKNVANASQALAALLSKINSLTKPCSSILPSRPTLRAKANQLSFWDARVNGSIPVSSLPGSVPSVPGATIGSEVANSYAVTLYGPNHSISPNVALGGAFFTQSYSAQQTTLLHEDLHYALQKNDQQVVQKYNILPGPFDNFSSAFNRWLTNNCH